ncbi:nucleoid-associated protein [Pseudomonas putida]|uniref:Nucleoid-associated protein n=1 Tax=Pseudomonas putida TaxID=303 RepID=A0A6I6XL40_PSEPU|nr:nucleoid-associated protein [Pseudomonas putida]QHG66417.1 nucleoid-associated protein [Pseudomonas putida]
MSFFSDEEIGSLKITRMILHVVGTKNFEAQPERALEEEAFFISKIVDMAAAPIFMFKAVSTTRHEIEAIASGATPFVDGAQSLAASFNRAHVGGSADGVLLMFELSVKDPNVKIYSLIKYDYKLALEQNDGAPGNKLRRIVNALVDEKKAIQKTALIRVANAVADKSVSATDRTKHGVDLADYFTDFLAVAREVSDTELSEITRKVLKAALQTCIEHLPGKDVAKALKKAQANLGTRTLIDENAIVEAVMLAAGHPEDDKIAARLEKETRTRVKKSKLHELSFKPDRKILRQPYMRKIVTTEGVTILFPDRTENPNVRVVELRGGKKQIIVDTDRVTEDSVVTPKAGQPT